jgi:hypothetical protein
VRSYYDETDVRNIRGDFRFRGRATNPGNGSSSGFRAFADFLLGQPDQTQRQVGYQPARLSGWQMAGFADDAWRVRPSLTIDVGVRYDVQVPLVEASNRLANFIPDLGQVVFAGDSRYPRALVNTDWDNVAPRAGFALTPFGNEKTVIRGGAGIFYSLETFNTTRQILAVSYPFVLREQYSRSASDPTALTLSNPFPAGRGSVVGVDQPSGMAVDYQAPRIIEGHLTIERQIGLRTSVELGYVGSSGRHLGRRYNLNQPIPVGLAANGTLLTVMPFPQFGDIQYEDQTNPSTYNAFQASIRRRAGESLTLLASYTLARAADQGSSSTGNLSNTSTSGNQKAPQDIHDMAAEHGLSDYHREHKFNAAFVYELPFGAGRRWLTDSGGLVNGLFGQWQVAGIVTWLSGRPYTPQYSAPDIAMQRPDLSGDPMANVPAGLWFNPAAFTRPVATAAQPDLYGNAGRNILIGPDFRNVDLALYKAFHLAGRAALQVRIEAFNLLNRANYQVPVFLLDRSDVGRVTSTVNEPRELQFAVKLIF